MRRRWLFEEILDRKGVAFFRRDRGIKREDSIARTIEASLEFLEEPADRERALELGIFPAETEIPMTTVAALWQLDAFDAELVAARLGDLALVKLRATSLRMHDVFRRYFFEKCAEQSGPAAPPRSAHRRLGRSAPPAGHLRLGPRGPSFISGRPSGSAGRVLARLPLAPRKFHAIDAIGLRDDAALFLDDQDLWYLARAWASRRTFWSAIQRRCAASFTAV